jgi:hypothetical protein
VRLCLLSLMLLVACPCGCGGNLWGPESGDDDVAPPDDDDTSATDDDDGPDDDDHAVEHVPGVEDPAAALFGLDVVHQIEIELPAESLASLESWPEEFTYDLPYDYVPGALLIDGDRLDDVAVRLKGRWGSYRGMTDKAAFKIDLNRYVAGQDYHGLEKLTLNNMIVDCSMAKEVLALELYRARGLVTPRIGYAWVTVNGEPFGLYALVETIDDAFLETHLAEPGGNLYEPEYVVHADYTYTLVDFDTSSQHWFQLEEGQDVGLADVHAVTEALDVYSGTEHYLAEVGQRVDFEQLQTLFSVEQWIGQNDGYALNINNYFVYFDPGDGKARIIPWDLDYSFLFASDWVFDWRDPAGRLAETCWDDAACLGGYLAQLETTCQTADDMGLEPLLLDVLALTDPYVAQDPRSECYAYQVEDYRNHLWAWIADRSNVVRGTWGL